LPVFRPFVFAIQYSCAFEFEQFVPRFKGFFLASERSVKPQSASNILLRKMFDEMRKSKKNKRRRVLKPLRASLSASRRMQKKKRKRAAAGASLRSLLPCLLLLLRLLHHLRLLHLLHLPALLSLLQLFDITRCIFIQPAHHDGVSHSAGQRIDEQLKQLTAALLTTRGKGGWLLRLLPDRLLLLLRLLRLHELRLHDLLEANRMRFEIALERGTQGQWQRQLDRRGGGERRLLQLLCLLLLWPLLLLLQLRSSGLLWL
jgi:hypothetical protein